ncbi:MAG: flavin reductase family protein, partial [Paracoccus sp. (in: a-proteobacteria)]
RLNVYPKDEGRGIDLAPLVADLPAGGQIYSCGPARMLLALEELTAHLPEGTFRFEHFSSGGSGLDPSKEQAFEAELTDSGMTVRVDADKTLLDALLAVGIDVPHDCCEGLCGSCEVAVVEGEVDHRDMVLTRAERARNDRMMSCCSRARDGGRIRLAL